MNKKNLPSEICFCDFSAHTSSKLNNTLVIMWGRDKNFQVSMMNELRNRENKISLGEVFFYSPFTIEEEKKQWIK